MKRFWQSLPLLVAVMFALPAQAALHEVVVLTNAKADTREASRDQAIAVAQRMAIAKVAQKLNPGKAQEYLKTLNAKSIKTLLRGTTVVEETRIDGVYYAKVRVTIVDTPILEAYGETVKQEVTDDNPRRAIVVLPVFFNGTEPNVWDAKKNPTYPMWRDATYAIGLGALIVPGGKPDERAIVDRDNVLSVNYVGLQPLLDAYGADEAAVVVVNDPEGTPETDPLEVMVRRIRENGQRVERFQMKPEKQAKGGIESRDALRVRAVRRAAQMLARATESTAYIEQRAKRAAKQQPITVQFMRLKEWSDIEQKLRNVPGFVALDTLSIGVNQASLILYVKENPEDARKALVEQGVIVAEVEGTWRIRSR